MGIVSELSLSGPGLRRTLTELLARVPSPYLTTTGARSGLPRTVPLVAVVVDEQLGVIGSSSDRLTSPPG